MMAERVSIALVIKQMNLGERAQPAPTFTFSSLTAIRPKAEIPLRTTYITRTTINSHNESNREGKQQKKDRSNKSY